MSTIKLGALCWNQYSDWPSLLDAGVRADTLGYDTLWTWDHLYPIVGSHDGPIFEGWLTLAAWAQATTNVRIGLMVGANTFREPTLTAKMATTLDHISERPGDPGHRRGVVRDRARARSASSSATARRSGCAGWARRCRSCAGCSTARSRRRPGPHYAAKDVRNDPPPVQAAPAAPHRRRRRAGHPQAGRPLRRRQQRRWRHRERQAQGSHPRCSTARPSAATRPRSSARPASGR